MLSLIDNYKDKIYLWTVIITGFSLAGFFLPQFHLSPQSVFAVGFLSLCAFLAEVYEVEIIYKITTSTSAAIYTAAIFLGRTPLALSIALPATITSELFIRWTTKPDDATIIDLLYKVLFNSSQILISVMLASAVFSLSGGQYPPYASIHDYLPPILTFATYTVVNTSLVSGIISLTQEINFIYNLLFKLKNLPVQLISMGVLSIIIAVLYAVSPWNLLLIVFLLVLVNRSLRNYMKLRHEAKNTFEKMMDLLSKRDPYTAEHSEEVAEMSHALSRELDLSEERTETIVSAARIHDIGKIGIPDKILLKPGKLTDDEWEIMKEHSEIGAEILSELEIYNDAVDIVRHEHERWNGSGYPDGLSGDEIPLGARVVAVADVWNALRTERPYRGPLSKEESLEIIKDMKGDELDPEISEALIKIVN